MMPPSDAHLEEALRDYNDEAYRLESAGGSERELLDVYLNRGAVLSMMDSYVSALSDFDDAVEIMMHLEAAGEEVDAGAYIKALVSRGELLSKDVRCMADDYAAAALRLHELHADSRYYDRRRTVLMCIGCIEDLIDAGITSGIDPFAEKAGSLLTAREDPWSLNRRLDLLNVLSQAARMAGDDDRATGMLTEAIGVGRELLERGHLEDMMSLVFSFIVRGDIRHERNEMDEYIADRKAAIILLEEMLGANRLDDVQVLAHMHQDLANTYLLLERVKEAEEHLMREVALGITHGRREL
jgi:tetratricopeptide (TPR) repeat protein